MSQELKLDVKLLKEQIRKKLGEAGTEEIEDVIDDAIDSVN